MEFRVCEAEQLSTRKLQKKIVRLKNTKKKKEQHKGQLILLSGYSGGLSIKSEKQDYFPTPFMIIVPIIITVFILP